jgi:nicotinamide mononucleotide transporter
MMKNYFKDWNLWDWSWTIIASAIGIYLGAKWGGLLSIVTCLTGLWCVILVAKGRIFNYYLGIINVLGYAYIAYGYQLYGEVMLNALYFLPMQFVGLYFWTRNKDLTIPDKVKIKFLSPIKRIEWLVLTLMSTIVYTWILKYMGDPVPFLDSVSSILSVIAMLLMAFRYMEQWILWIVVDIVSIAMWIIVLMSEGVNDIAMLVMWSAYLVNAVYGFISWLKMGETDV